MVASDHGGTPSQYQSVDVNGVLEQAGLLTKKDGRIDWSGIRAAYVGLIYMFVNLKGREPNGIVDPADYDRTRREIIDAFMVYRDPATGRLYWS